MSEPKEIRLSLFNEASAQELPPPVDVSVGLVSQPGDTDTQITVGVVPVWGLAVGWVLAIVLVSQAVKYLLKAVGIKERLGQRSWRRWMYVTPIAVGVLLSGMFGPQITKMFGLQFGLLPSLVILGPGSGAAAAFTYDVFRSVVLPVLPAVVVGLIERVTKIELPVTAKELELGEDSEVLP